MKVIIVKMATRASNRPTRGIGPARLIEEIAVTPARRRAPHRPPGLASPPPRPDGPAFSPPPHAQLPLLSPPPLPQVREEGTRVAGLQEMLQHGGRHAAQVADREAEWELEQQAAVQGQGDEVDDLPDLDVEVGDGDPEGGDDILLLPPRTNPAVPPPRQVPEGSASWEAIHRLGGWESFLVEFPMLEEISEQHKGAWVLAWVECMTRWRDADSEEGKETALLWLGFLAQALQRKPLREWNKGRVEVASRYRCVQEGDWAGLVERF